MMKKKLIQGAGGGKSGGGGGRAPVEDPDSLQSRAYARVLDLICEGEIVGLANGAQSIYLDTTPLQSANGEYNFSGVSYDYRVGTQSQEYILGFDSVESETSVGVECTVDTPVVRTISDQEVSAVRVRISIPQLTEQNTSNGDLKGSEVTIAIDVQSDGQGYVEELQDTIIGKSTSKYERSYRIDLEGRPPWDIRLRRITADSTSVTLQNKTYFESYTELIDARLGYPNSALISVEIDSKQFSSVPTRGYDVKLLKIRIPSNATVRDDGSLTYSGSWDGTFQVAWSSNPAWVLYDLIINTRYGLGNFITSSQVDKWALYSIGQYCDELIDDGFGSTEPRFSCNLYIQSRQEAYKVIQDLCSVFNAMAYWAGGTLTVVQDKPSDAMHLFSPANVIDGAFTYSGSSAKARHTVAVVTWNDPEDFYRQKVEYVEDADAITRFGVIETQVVALGCTSRGQANRLGRWILYSESDQTETVTFRVGMDGALVRPGEVIKVADPVRAGSRRAGRISAATTTTVTIDDDITFDASTHTLSVLLPDGTVEERQVLTLAGRVITVTSAFSEAPQAQSIWMISSTAIEPQYFRIVSIAESEDSSYAITALAHNPDKYDAIEDGLVLQTRSISALTSVPEAPSGLTITETLYAVGADVRVKVTVSWNRVSFATSYFVQYQIDSGNIIQLPETTTNEIEILNAEPGIYYVTVYAANAAGTRSPPSSGQKEIIGKIAAPGNMTGFSLFPNSGMAYLSWTESEDLDVLIGGSVRIRWTPEIVTPVWKNAVDIVPALPGNSTRATAPLLEGTYLAKFVDSSGVASSTPASIVTTIPEALALNVVSTLTEHSSFAGTKSSVELISGYGLSADGIGLSGIFIDDIPDIDSLLTIDFGGGVVSSGTYSFANSLDLGAVYTSTVTAHLYGEAIDIADSIDYRLDMVDDWVDLDGDFIDDVSVELQVRTTEDNPSGTPTWSDWKRFFAGSYKARAFEFRLLFETESSDHNFVVQELSVTIDMPDRTIQATGLISGATTYTYTYAEPFKETPAVGITAYNLNSGDYYVISNNTRTGFDILFKDSGGTNVSRTFDVLAKGYGRQV